MPLIIALLREHPTVLSGLVRPSVESVPVYAKGDLTIDHGREGLHKRSAATIVNSKGHSDRPSTFSRSHHKIFASTRRSNLSHGPGPVFRNGNGSPPLPVCRRGWL